MMKYDRICSNQNYMTSNFRVSHVIKESREFGKKVREQRTCKSQEKQKDMTKCLSGVRWSEPTTCSHFIYQLPNINSLSPSPNFISISNLYKKNKQLNIGDNRKSLYYDLLYTKIKEETTCSCIKYEARAKPRSKKPFHDASGRQEPIK